MKFTLKAYVRFRRNSLSKVESLLTGWSGLSDETLSSWGFDVLGVTGASDADTWRCTSFDRSPSFTSRYQFFQTSDFVCFTVADRCCCCCCSATVASTVLLRLLPLLKLLLLLLLLPLLLLLRSCALALCVAILIDASSPLHTTNSLSEKSTCISKLSEWCQFLIESFISGNQRVSLPFFKVIEIKMCKGLKECHQMLKAMSSKNILRANQNIILNISDDSTNYGPVVIW